MSTEKIENKGLPIEEGMEYSVIKKHLPFLEWGLFTLIMSSLIIVAGAVVFLIKGNPGYTDGKFHFDVKTALNIGLDFQGGARVQAKFKDPSVDIHKIRKAFSDEKMPANINTVGDPKDNTYQITTSVMTKVASEQVNKITEFIRLKFDPAPVTNITNNVTNVAATSMIDVLGSELVEPKEGAAFAGRALLLLMLVSALILVYVAIRFSFFYGTGAILALIHDILIMLSFSVFFNVVFDITIIAALLTILGYSINDTIVVFDRIREHHKINKDEDLRLTMDKSITQTLSRTIITSLTVTFVAAAIWLFSGEVLSSFGFLITIGVISGTYSSIFIASPVTYWLTKAFERRPKKSEKAKA